MQVQQWGLNSRTPSNSVQDDSMTRTGSVAAGGLVAGRFMIHSAKISP